MREIITSKRLDENYIKINHPSGLTILLCPMQGFSTTYALFATKYGSVDTCFKLEGEEDFLTVPEGIAHFLEHKLFESDKGDAFTRFSKTGASANAYTSFDKTAYLFSCSDNFEESFEILLDFVTNPYFTQQTVEKEQGIIGQEIRMYDDNPDWRVFFNLLCAMYKNHPVRIDIAGTVESIAKIDADLLYRCYNTFYNLNNMVLSVAGGFDADKAAQIADRILKKADDKKLYTQTPHEPKEVNQNYIHQCLPVAMPLFQAGFKGIALPKEEQLKAQIADEVLVDILTGETGDFYKKLYDTGVINATFGSDVFTARDYASIIFSGESREPKKVFELLKAEIERVKKEGIPKEDFDRSKQSIYGKYIGLYSRPETISTVMMQTHFMDCGLYDIIEAVAETELEYITSRLIAIDTEQSALSVVSAKEI